MFPDGKPQRSRGVGERGRGATDDGDGAPHRSAPSGDHLGDLNEKVSSQRQRPHRVSGCHCIRKRTQTYANARKGTKKAGQRTGAIDHSRRQKKSHPQGWLGWGMGDEGRCYMAQFASSGNAWASNSNAQRSSWFGH